jgi:hypothetical protein
MSAASGRASGPDGDPLRITVAESFAREVNQRRVRHLQFDSARQTECCAPWGGTGSLSAGDSPVPLDLADRSPAIDPTSLLVLVWTTLYRFIATSSDGVNRPDLSTRAVRAICAFYEAYELK